MENSDIDVQMNSDDENSEDEELIQFAVLIASPRSERIFRHRSDYIRFWTEDEFLQKFRVRKNVVDIRKPTFPGDHQVRNTNN